MALFCVLQSHHHKGTTSPSKRQQFPQALGGMTKPMLKLTSSLKRILSLSLFAVLIIQIASSGSYQLAYAQTTRRVFLPLIMNNFQSPPPFTYSFYVQDNTTIQDKATELGQRNMAAGYPQDSIIILAFGNPSSRSVSGGTEYGVALVNRGYIPFYSVNLAVQNFAYAWLNATANSSHKLRIVVGINNYGAGFTTTHAQQFAGWMSVMYAPFIGNSRVSLVAGVDAETEWSAAIAANAYIEAFRDGLPAGYCTPGPLEEKCLYDFGNAGGCSITGGNGCNNGWTYDNVWYKSTGLKRPSDTYRFAAALPEIYNTAGSNGKQWQNASLRGIALENQPVFFAGVLTTKEACRQVSTYGGSNACPGYDNTPEQGFSNLRDSLNSDNRTSQVPIRWLTDISYQAYP